MTRFEFQTQLDRLTKVYGVHYYTTDRVFMLWRELQNLNLATLERIVGEFISTSLQPPLVVDFREALAREREREHQKQKDQQGKESEAFSFGSSLSSEEEKMLFASIKKLASGNISNNDRASFMSMVKQMAHVDGACRKCDDTGIYFLEHNVVKKCSCNIGRLDRRKI